MRHVLLYGPPAAGKLTVAKALAERYGLTLLDNHLTFDMALRLFAFGTAEFNELVERLRTVLFEATAAAGRDSVSTLVFAHPNDRAYVARAEASVARFGVEVFRVQLCPPPAVLHQRVASGSRLGSNKVRDTTTLTGILAQHDLYTPIAETDLRIDNTELGPDAVVAEIAAHVGF